MTLHQQLREALDKKLAARTPQEREDAAEAFGRLVRLANTGRDRTPQSFVRLGGEGDEA